MVCVDVGTMGFVDVGMMGFVDVGGNLMEHFICV